MTLFAAGTWATIGMGALSAGTSLYSSNAAAKAGARDASRASAAEGAAIAKERLNATVRNSYNTAFSQMQLGLKKKQLAEQGAGISAAALAARGDAAMSASATGSIGASTQAVISDIDMKSQAALDMTTDAFESAIETYNNDLNMMVLNTDQSAPNMRPVEYSGPSGGQMLGSALLSGASSITSSYAMRRLSLGLGPTAPTAASNVSAVNNMSIGFDPSTRLGNTSSFFNTRF